MEIPMILYPEDMTSDADELSTMTYISYFRDYEEKRGQRNLDDKVLCFMCIFVCVWC